MNLGELIKGIAYLLESVGSPGQWDRAAYIKEIARASAYATLKLGLTPAWVTTGNMAGTNSFTFSTTPLAILLVKESKVDLLNSTSIGALGGAVPLDIDGFIPKAFLPVGYIQEPMPQVIDCGELL